MCEEYRLNDRYVSQWTSCQFILLFINRCKIRVQLKQHAMKKTLLLTAALFIGLAGITMQTQAELKAGDKAPDFSLPGSDGKTYKLSDFAGKQAVVIAWYPKAFTGG
jgi:hypothetical protein